MSGGLDVSHLTPQDAVAALRSFPRRFAALLEVRDDEDESALSKELLETLRGHRWEREWRVP